MLSFPTVILLLLTLSIPRIADLRTLLDERYGADVFAVDGGLLIVGGSRERNVIELLALDNPNSHAVAAAPRVLLHSATARLDEKRVLVTGGSYSMNPGHGFPFGSFGWEGAFILDVETGVIDVTPSMSEARSRHTATRMPDGSVLIAGGEIVIMGGFSYLREVHHSVDRYFPDLARFTPAAPMLTGRAGHSATALADGRLLFAGGAPEPSAEIYDPATGMSVPLTMNVARSDHTATLLRDGRVVIAGGRAVVGNVEVSEIEIFDPRTRTFEVAARDRIARTGVAAVLLPEGRLLLAGGNSSFSPLREVTLFDPVTGTVTPHPPLAIPRSHPAAVIMPDGRVVVIGGGSATAEVFAPRQGSRRRPTRRVGTAASQEPAITASER